MSRPTISRRQFLRMSVLGTAAALAACSPTPTPEPTQAPADTQAPATQAPAATPAPAATQAAGATQAPAATAVPVAKYKESPTLADLVKAGKLPPVEQRLPESPLVVQPLDSIGTYGGQWHSGTIERNGNDLLRNIGYEQLLRYSPDYKTVLMNLAESVKAND